MKKYQLWLQRKSYSQHLINLIKIKTSLHTPEHPHRRYHTKMPTNPTPLPFRHSQDILDYRTREPSRAADTSYPTRDLKRKKAQALREFEIEKENSSMARRMQQVKSVVTLQRQPSALELSRRRSNEKKYEQSNDELRESKFRKYVKWQNTTVSSLHRYYLTLQVLNLGRLLHLRHDYAGLWCEVESERGVVRSDINQLSSLGTYRYCFPLEQELGQRVTLRFYTCKGIQSDKIGEFVIEKLGVGECKEGWYRSTDGRFEIELRMKYNKVLKNRACIPFK